MPYSIVVEMRMLHGTFVEYRHVETVSQQIEICHPITERSLHAERRITAGKAARRRDRNAHIRRRCSPSSDKHGQCSRTRSRFDHHDRSPHLLTRPVDHCVPVSAVSNPSPRISRRSELRDREDQ